MYDFIEIIMDKFIDTENLQDLMNFSQSLLTNNNFNNFSDNMEYVDIQQCEYFFYFQFLKLFNKCNQFVYKKCNHQQTKRKVCQFIETVFKYTDAPGIIALRTEVIKLYSAHLLDKNNNLITFLTQEKTEKSSNGQMTFNFKDEDTRIQKINSYLIKENSYRKKMAVKNLKQVKFTTEMKSSSENLAVSSV